MATPAVWLALALAGRAQAQPAQPDSDGDGISDAEEDANHNGVVDPGETDPHSVDSDGDNVPDDVERRMGTNPADTRDVPPIPEPLFVDLVRNLGSRRGEIEMNVLASTTFSGRPTVRWGPEIEYVPLSGLGFELEVPLADGRVDALKWGAQVTAASTQARRLEVGVLGSHEVKVHTTASTTVLAAVTGVRFSSRWQAITIVGPTLSTARGRSPAVGGQLGPSVFYQATRGLTFGLELGHRIIAGERSAQLALPQLHVNPSAAWKLQLGVGGSTEGDGRLHPFTALRVCWEP